MRLLLDTHALLWWLADSPRLGAQAHGLIADPLNEAWASIVSLWEIAAKARIGKLHADMNEIEQALAPSGLRLLDLRLPHLHRLQTLPVFAEHRDPFDHLLFAQALAEDLTLLSDDGNASRYELKLLRCR